jgi:hypothetical protein
MNLISVAPVEGGWKVESQALAAPLFFYSGGRAEAAAKRLGEAFAKAGEWSEIQVQVAGGQLVGRFVCPPALTQAA